MKQDQYSVLYNVTLSLAVHGTTYTVPTSDIVSITLIHNYDTMTFPIVRIRFESDLSLIQNILDYPDDIQILGNLNGNIYRLDEDTRPSCVSGAKNISFALKGYIENKNAPTSKMDQYDNGLPRSSDLNTNNKVPFEIFGYNQSMIYNMKRLTKSVYHNIPVQDVMEDMLSRRGIYDYKIRIVEQQTKFDQILIPNLDIIHAFAYIDQYYGLYKAGGQLYGDLDKLYITSSSTDITDGSLIPINVEDYKSNSDMGGLRKHSDGSYIMHALSSNVSVLTESDIERIINADSVNAINVNTEDVQNESLKELYTNSNLSGKDETPNILHKHVNPFIASMNAARVKERTTQVDLSCTGMDIGNLSIESRINLIYQTAIRGTNLSGMYRMSYANHILTILDGELFTSTSAFRLCKNY